MSDPHSMRFELALAAWGTADFESSLKLEMARGRDGLPLQRGLALGNQVTASPITVVIHHASATGKLIRVRAGIFYASVIGGCSCADDPTPIDENTEYCEVELAIDRKTGEAAVELLE